MVGLKTHTYTCEHTHTNAHAHMGALSMPRTSAWNLSTIAGWCWVTGPHFLCSQDGENGPFP